MKHELGGESSLVGDRFDLDDFSDREVEIEVCLPVYEVDDSAK